MSVFHQQINQRRYGLLSSVGCFFHQDASKRKKSMVVAPTLDEMPEKFWIDTNDWVKTLSGDLQIVFMRVDVSLELKRSRKAGRRRDQERQSWAH